MLEKTKVLQEEERQLKNEISNLISDFYYKHGLIPVVENLTYKDEQGYVRTEPCVIVKAFVRG